MKLDTGRELIEVDGCYVEKDVLGIVERIKQYDPNLEVFCLNPESSADINEAPYIVAELCADGKYRRVFEVWQLDNTVLERIFNADNQRHDLEAVMTQMRFSNQAAAERRYREAMGENADIGEHLIKTPKTTYSLPASDGSTIWVDSHLGVVKRRDPN